MLYDIIETAESFDETGLPSQSYVPQSVAPGAPAPPPPSGFTSAGGGVQGQAAAAAVSPSGGGAGAAGTKGGAGPTPLFDEAEMH